MIKIFRNIRKSLLGQGKTKQYLLYALGEIILVVIGILIALQIDNINEDHKKRQVEISYLKRLTIDLKDNEKLWSDFHDMKQQQLKASNIFLNFSFSNNKDSVFNIMPYFGSIFSWIDININQVTFEEMVSSGNLDLISNDSIKIKLLNLNNLYKSILAVQVKDKESHDRFLFPSINKTFNMRYSMALEPSKQKEIGRTFSAKEMGFYLNEFKKEMIELTENQSFMNGLVAIQSNAPVSINQFSTAKKNVSELIALIEQELKTSD